MRLILQILLILIVVSTISICTVKPDMHKNVIVYDSAYKLVEETVAETKKEEIPIMEMPVKPVEVTTSVEKRVEPQRVETKKQEVKQVQTYTTPKVSTTTQPKTTTKTQTTVQKKQETKTEPVKTVERINAQIPKVEQKTVTKKVEQPKVLTEQEETIAWNVWRSNLTNKIMQDTRLPMLPAGVVFRFSFTVDKYGKISNVQTWSETSTYTPYAIQYIAPVIRSYQGRDILNFPEGTQRITTEAKGGWKISATEKYSTPQDYNDVEKVRK